jgi:hypothetical protein
VVSREQIFAALFALSQSATGFLTRSRSIEMWEKVPSEMQPALYQSEGRQTAEGPSQRLTKWTFFAEWTVYAHAANTSGDVVTLLNTLVDALVAALDPGPAYDAQTLGGLVTSCRIIGDIETSEGRLGPQAVAIIPLLIIANA